MKRRIPAGESEDRLIALATALRGLRAVEDICAFLEDLCTPAELEAMTDRWRAVTLLLRGLPYRDIHALTGVSVTTIGRVARTLERGTGGYATAARADAPASESV